MVRVWELIDLAPPASEAGIRSEALQASDGRLQCPHMEARMTWRSSEVHEGMEKTANEVSVGSSPTTPHIARVRVRVFHVIRDQVFRPSASSTSVQKV